MKKELFTGICCILLLILCSCSVKEIPAPETTEVQTETVTVPMELLPTEPEAVEEIIMSESYYFSAYVDDILYQRYITLYPNASFYDARWTQENSWGTYVQEEGGRITIDIGGESCVFRRTETRLVLENGSFNIFSDTGAVAVEPGTGSGSKHVSMLTGGIYVLDTSKYDFIFDEVLMDLDLTDMTFTLKCFDGSVVDGTLDFEEDRLVCTHAGGKMMFNVNISGLMDTRTDLEKGTVITDQLMFCPQVDTSMRLYTFLYAEDQQQEITADPEADPLDNYKHLYKRNYQFRCYATENGENKLCTFEIYHYPLEGKWKFKGASKAEDLETEEKPDGTIIFSQGSKQWNFRREEENLCYDGGSLLSASGWDSNTSTRLEQEVPVGAVFRVYEENYIYDGLYILPYETLDETYAAIQIDTKHQYLWIHCYDGTILEGHYFYEGNYIRLPVEINDPMFGPRIIDVTLFPCEHGLNVRNEGVRDVWEILIGPGGISDTFNFFPVQGVIPQESIEE